MRKKFNLSKNEIIILVFLPLVSFDWRLFIVDPLLGNSIFLQDDLYYYFKIAKNFWSYYYFTFDGIHETNGFHPLWQFLLVVSAFFFSDASFIKIALLINIILILLFLQLFRWFLLENKLSLISLYVTVIILCAFPATGQFLFNGMETSLGAFFALGAFCIFSKTVKDNSNTVRDGIYFGALTGLAMLSRLDIFVIFLIPYFYLFIYFRKIFFIGAIVHLFLLTPFLLWVHSQNNSIVPISGMVKSYYSDIFSNSFGLQDIFLETIVYLKYIPMFAPLYVLSQLMLDYFITIILSSIWIGIYCWYWVRKVRLIELSIIPYIFIGSVFLYLVYQSVYYNLLQTGLDLWTIGLSIVLFTYVSLIPIKLRKVEVFLAIIEKQSYGKYLIISLLFVTILQIYNFVCYQNHRIFQTNSGTTGNVYVEAAKWANVNLPDESIVGAWAAGQLGYHLNFRTVQLEGLVNNSNYLRVIKDETFSEYVCSEKIDYLFLNHDSFKKNWKEFDPNDLSHKSSPYREYRARFLKQVWTDLSLTYVYSGNVTSYDSNQQSYYFIWKIIRDNLCKN